MPALARNLWHLLVGAPAGEGCSAATSENGLPIFSQQVGMVVVEIRSNDGLGHLEISGWEIEGAEYVPSFRCEVFAEASGFQGKNTV